MQVDKSTKVLTGVVISLHLALSVDRFLKYSEIVDASWYLLIACCDLFLVLVALAWAVQGLLKRTTAAALPLLAAVGLSPLIFFSAHVGRWTRRQIFEYRLPQYEAAAQWASRLASGAGRVEVALPPELSHLALDVYVRDNAERGSSVEFITAKTRPGPLAGYLYQSNDDPDEETTRAWEQRTRIAPRWYRIERS